MGEVMKFGCILAEEERSKIEIQWWMAAMAGRQEARSFE
jgi:hypothetical protein